MKRKYVLFLGLFVGIFSIAATPIFSTKVTESLKSMLNSEGKFTQIIPADTGCTVTGNLNVSGDLSGATSAIKNGTSTYYTPFVLYQNYAGSTMTGNTSTQLDSFVLPAGLLGTKDAMEVYAEYEFEDLTGQKTIGCALGIGGTSNLFNIGTIGTATTGYSGTALLQNKGSTTANFVKKIWRLVGQNTSTSSVDANNTLDTNVNNTFIIYARNSVPATGTITLHCVRVTIFKEQD